MQSSIIHDAVTPIAWLIGTWSTTNGKGSYPTIQDFSYHETIEFASVGQPMLNFVSTSTHPEKRTPMHQERGFLRIKPGSNDLAFVVSHNFGLTSVEEGIVDPQTKEINLKTTSASRMSFAKPPHVKGFQRNIKLLSSDTMQITILMETENTGLTEHLKAVYKRAEIV